MLRLENRFVDQLVDKNRKARPCLAIEKYHDGMGWDGMGWDPRNRDSNKFITFPFGPRYFVRCVPFNVLGETEFCEAWPSRLTFPSSPVLRTIIELPETFPHRYRSSRGFSIGHARTFEISAE